MIFKSDIEKLEEYSHLSRSSTGTIWFGHYPVSTIISPKSLKFIMADGIAYLCGHLHTLGGLISKFYTRHTNGLLELELGDWKDNRIFRILAFDGGIFSFEDYSASESIFVLITNPKNIQFKTERERNIGKIRYSTHIRFLIFSQKPINKSSVYIDDKYVGSAYKANSTSPLYLLPWNPDDYKNGIHTIRILVLVSLQVLSINVKLT